MIWFRSIYDSLLIILLFISVRQALLSSPNRQLYFVFYIFLVVLIESIGYSLDRFWDMPNNWVYNTYMLCALFYFGFFYYRTYQSKMFKHIAILIPMVLTCSFLLFLPENFLSFKSEFAIKGNLILLFGFIWLCLLYFLDIIIASSVIRMTNSFAFWVTIGLLIWSVLVTIRFAGLNFFSNHNEILLFKVTSFTYIINIITYSMFLKGIICLKHQKK